MGLISLAMASNAQNEATGARMQAQQAEVRMEAKLAAAQASGQMGGAKSINVTVPAGAQPGGLLHIAYPDGQGTFRIQLPQNATPGMQLSVNVPEKPHVSPEQLNAVIAALRMELKQEVAALKADLAEEKATTVKLSAEVKRLGGSVEVKHE